MSSLLIADHNNTELKPFTLNAITAASQIDPDLHVLILGYNSEGVAKSLSEIPNVKKVIHVDNEIYKNYIAENFTSVVLRHAENYSHIISSANTFGKNLMPRIAALLNWPQATFASKINVKDSSLEVTREVDEGLETIEVNIPAIVTCDLRLNEPRYASLPNIMKAKKKPLEQINASDLGVDTKARIEQIKVEDPPKRKAGIKVANVSELVQKLKNDAKVI